MLERVLQPAIAFAVKDFLENLRSGRLIVVSVLVGAILIGVSAALAASLPALDGVEGEVPAPLEVWHKGPDGVSAGVAFGLGPVILPFLSILTASRLLQRERDRGIFQLSLANPVPPWGPALGRFVGAYGALAIPVVAISIGVSLAIQMVTGTPLELGFLAAYIGGNVLLVGLYLILTLLVGTLVLVEFVTPLVTLIWFGFNMLRQTAYILLARLSTILGGDEAVLFQVSWVDLVTFTGLYQGFLASWVPPSLGFVALPSLGDPLALAAQAIPWGILVWFVALFAIYAITLHRPPAQ